MLTEMNFNKRNVAVSICMITYNQGKFIEQAIRSVLCQKTNFDFQLVVADDCSIDNTKDILNSLKFEFPDNLIVKLSHVNNGVHKNFASALNQCNGEYIALCDGDDYWTDPNKLQTQFDLMEANPDCAICFHNMEVQYESNEKPSHKSNRNQKEVTDITHLCAENYIYTASSFLRRIAMPAHPAWFASAMPLDYPIFVLAARNGNIRYIDKTMGVYRIHGGGIWNPSGRKRHYFKVYRTLKNLDAELKYKYTDIFRKRIARHEFDFLQQLLKEGRFGRARRYHALLLRKYLNSAPRLYRYLLSYGLRSHLQLQP